jgi:hypothetical protein
MERYGSGKYGQRALRRISKNVMNNTSKTNWEKLDSLTEEIDTSDIPPLTKEFFSKSRWWKPVEPLNVLVEFESIGILEIQNIELLKAPIKVQA